VAATAVVAMPVAAAATAIANAAAASSKARLALRPPSRRATSPLLRPLLQGLAPLEPEVPGR
jgi:hypothetical protein